MSAALHPQTARPVQILRDWLYLEPVTGCNLRCGICYSAYDTLKNSRTVPRDRIVSLAAEYMARVEANEDPGVYRCGTGEIFFYPGFSELVNELSERWPTLHHVVRTNGTVMPEPPFRCWPRMTFHVSIDGLKEAHEANRWRGTFDKSLAFSKHVLAQGAEVVARCVVTRQNLAELAALEDLLLREVGPTCRLSLTLPYDNHLIEQAASPSLRKGFHGRSLNLLLSLSHAEAVAALCLQYDREFLARTCSDALASEHGPLPIHIYPAVSVDGIYTCCERIVKIGEPTDSLAEVMSRLVPSSCDGCGMAVACRT